MAVSVLLLAAATANAAGILLSRVVRNEREFALRLALGAEKRHLLRVLLLDAMPIVGIAMLAGGAGAVMTTETVHSSALPLLSWGAPSLSRNALLAGGAIGVFCLCCLLLFPWIQVRRTSLTPLLNEGSFGNASRSSFARSLLVALQTGTATLLISGALLFVRTYEQLRGEQLGFDAQRVAVADFPSLSDSLSPWEVRERLNALAARLRATPGVIGAGVSSGVPLRQSAATSISIGGRRVEPLATGGPYVDALDGHALRALDSRIVRGRAFEDSDRAGATPIVMINVTMARVVWGNDNPLGSCLHFMGEQTCRVVIGIVHDIQRDNVLEGETLQTFVPLDQAPDWLSPRAVFVRSSTPETLRTTLRALAPAAGLKASSYRFDLFREILEPDLVIWRVAGLVLGIYGAVSLLVAASGVFGTVSFSLAVRRRELAIRRALGSSFGGLLKTIGAPLGRACAIGIGAAVALVLAVWGRSETLFYGTDRSDVTWSSLLTVVVVWSVVSLGVVWGALTAWNAAVADTLKEP